MIAGLETPAQTQPAETITTPTEEAPAAEEPAAAEEAPALSGKVTVYMPSPAGLADKLAAAFTEKTGVEVEQFQGTTGEILARLEAEQANPVADVVILASWSDGLSMKADGQLESYTPANADKVNDGWIDEDNMGNTAQLRRRASADLFRQSCGLKSLKYIQYSLRFSNLGLTKNLSPNLLAELCGAAYALWFQRLCGRRDLQYHRCSRTERRLVRVGR